VTHRRKRLAVMLMAQNLTAFFNSKGSDGVMPVVGMSWWEWTDKTTGARGATSAW